MKLQDTRNSTAVILCGGLGKRLKKFTKKTPKPMVLIKNRPFLDILIGYLGRYGIKNIVLCTGYRSGVIEKYYRGKSGNLRISVSKESSPLGTAGAVKNAERKIESDPFIVLNGDSYCDVDLRKLLCFHKKKKAVITIALSKAENIDDYGNVELDGNKKIKAFREKTSKGTGNMVNSGIYIISKKALSEIPENRKYSLEYGLFNKTGDIYGFETNSRHYDIGTPERYEKAKKYFGSY